MPIKFVRQDITKIECDAIVNPTNSEMNPGGGADLAIHKTAGYKLFEFCKRIGRCAAGEAKITPGFGLPCKYIIHTVGPEWNSSGDARNLLVSCYSECLKLAVKHKCKTVAFPLISSGTNGAPKDEVLKIATRIIADFLLDNDILVYLVVFDRDSYEISSKVYSNIKAYIDDNYVSSYKKEFGYDKRLSRYNLPLYPVEKNIVAEEALEFSDEYECLSCPAPIQAAMPAPSLDDMIKNMDKGFADTLFYYIDSKGLTDVECYKRSNVDKKTFSKIKCNDKYKPSKVTAVSFAIGLRLNEEETNHLLGTIGFCLSNSNLFDVIIQYFISTGDYENIFDVNEVLYKFDQSTLGV